MSANDDLPMASISKASTLDEIADFWDTHSLSDYWDYTHEVAFEVRAQRRHRVTLDPHVYEQVAEEARIRGISPETLVNVWLSERLQQAESR